MPESLQYPLPFVPPLAWWIQQDDARALELAIDCALRVAGMEAAWEWSARSLGRADNDAEPPSCTQLELEFSVNRMSAMIVQNTFMCTPSEAKAHVDADHDADDEEGVEDVDEVLDALLCGTPPRSPATAWAQIELIEKGLRDRGVSGHDELIRMLALLVSPSYRAQGFGPRLLLTAPPSAGKTFLFGALADTLGIPSVHIDASILTPEGWHGTNVSELIGARLGRGPGKHTLEQWQEGAILVLDEIDKACRANPDDRHGTQVRLERQHTMLGLVWGGTPIRLKDGETIKTDRWIIAACGAFASSRFVAEQRPPTDAELIAWGMSPELASRLPTRLVLAPLSIPMLIERLRTDPRGLPHAKALAASFGCTLDVPDETLARLAVHSYANPAAFTVRTASACLVQAVIAQLAQAGASHIGARVSVPPDDLALPLAMARKPRRPPDDPEVQAPH